MQKHENEKKTYDLFTNFDLCGLRPLDPGVMSSNKSFLSLILGLICQQKHHRENKKLSFQQKNKNNREKTLWRRQLFLNRNVNKRTGKKKVMEYG